MAFDFSIGGDLKRYQPTDRPTDDTSTVGGGPNTATGLITNGDTNGLFPAQPIPTAGDPDSVWYYPEYLKNENGGTDELPAPLFLIRNGLKKPTSTTTASIVGDPGSVEAAPPGSRPQIRLVFINDTTSDWDEELVELNGANSVSSTKTVQSGGHFYAEIVSSGGSPIAAPYGVWVTVGTVLGYIPPGFSIGGSLFLIGVEDVKDQVLNVANRTVDPSAVEVSSFVEAYDVASALAIPGGLDLDDGEYIGIWFKSIRPNGMPDTLNAGFAPILRVRSVL